MEGDTVLAFLRRLPLRIQLLIAAVVVAGLAFAGLAIYWNQSPKMGFVCSDPPGPRTNAQVAGC